MYRITGQNIKNSNKLSDIEKIIIDHMLKWEDWNLKHNVIEEVFILTNESGLIELEASALFEAINHLVELKILKRRECEAIAYEWNVKEILLDYL